MSNSKSSTSPQSSMSLRERCQAAEIEQNQQDERFRRFMKAWSEFKSLKGEIVDAGYRRTLTTNLIEFGNVLREDGWIQILSSGDKKLFFSSSQAEHEKAIIRQVIYLYQQSSEHSARSSAILRLLNQSYDNVDARHISYFVESIRHHVPVLIWHLPLHAARQLVKVSAPISSVHIPGILRAINILKEIVETKSTSETVLDWINARMFEIHGEHHQTLLLNAHRSTFINDAAKIVMYAMMPSGYHIAEDCADILESHQLTVMQKSHLLQLRTNIIADLPYSLGHHITSSRHKSFSLRLQLEACLHVLEEPKNVPSENKNERLHEDHFCFYKDGNVYFVKAFGLSSSIPTCLGMGIIQKLFNQPHQPISNHVLLNESQTSRSISKANYAARQTLLDDSTLREASIKLIELDKEIAFAKEANDFGKQHKAEAEKANLLASINHSVGIHGKLRVFKSETNRRQNRVRRTFVTVHKYLNETAPPMSELSKHIRAFIKSRGDNYMYSPSDRAIKWKTEK